MFVPPIQGYKATWLALYGNLSRTEKKNAVYLNYKSIDSTDNGEFTRPISEAYFAIS